MQPTIPCVSFATVQNVCFVNDRKSVFRFCAVLVFKREAYGSQRERATTPEEIEALKQRSKETCKVKKLFKSFQLSLK